MLKYMKIGITINNILRDHISQVIKLNKAITDRDPIEPINPFDLEKSFPTIKDNATYNEFDPNKTVEFVENVDESPFDVDVLMYQDAAFEVFGRSEIIDKDIFLKLKHLEKKYKVQFVLLNKESEKSRNATLFFLSKNAFNLNEIVFPENNKDFWNYADIIVTDDPKILRYKPKNKISIKYINDFNKKTKSDYCINNLDGLNNILKRINNK